MISTTESVNVEESENHDLEEQYTFCNTSPRYASIKRKLETANDMNLLFILKEASDFKTDFGKYAKWGSRREIRAIIRD